MSGFINPALAAFVEAIGNEFVLAEVSIRRQGAGFELRHVQDQSAALDSLKTIQLTELRNLVDFSKNGQFRPLKSAPDLRSGWVLFLSSAGDLEFALNQFYPNGITDWFVARQKNPPVTNYRPFTTRQTGMYRITAMLDDAAATNVVRACCHRNFCLKQRLWTVASLSGDPLPEKSEIPCLEPCAILLEFARKGMRIEQEEAVPVRMSPSDAAALHAAVVYALSQRNPGIREADFALPQNSRRMQLALEKLISSGITLATVSEGE